MNDDRRESGCGTCLVWAAIILISAALLIAYLLPVINKKILTPLFGEGALYNAEQYLLELRENVAEWFSNLLSGKAGSIFGKGSSNPVNMTDVDTSGVSDLYYWYHTLDTEEQTAYLQILTGMENYSEEINIESDEAELKQLMLMIMADHPELFWVDSSYNYTIYEEYSTIRPIYNCTQAEKESRAAEIEQNIQEPLNEINAETSEYDKIRRCFIYLIDSVTYDLNASDSQNIYSSLVNKRSVCSGYARALQYLLQRSGIQTLYVTGDVTDRGGHAWNIVLCDGQYYNVDATYGDPNFADDAEGTQVFPAEMEHDYYYLCCSDDMLYRNRTADPELTQPACTSSQYNYYQMTGQYFTSYDSDLIDSMQNSILNGERFWECQLADQASYDELLNDIYNGLYGNMILSFYPELGSVQTSLSYRDSSYVVKLWY